MSPEINSLEDFLILPKKGEEACILFPLSPIAERLCELSLRAASRREIKVDHFAAGAPPAVPSTIAPLSITDLNESKNSEGALGALRRVISSTPSTHLFLFDFTAALPPWGGEGRHLRSFIEGVCASANKKGIRTLWLLPLAEGIEEATRHLAMHAPYVLLLQQAGLASFGQFIRQGSEFSPRLALPRRIRTTEMTFEFDPPSIPVVLTGPAPRGSDTGTDTGTTAGTDTGIDTVTGPDSGTRPDTPTGAGTTTTAVDALDIAYRKVFDSSPDGIILFNLKGNYREANPRACEILGRTEGEFREATLPSLLPKGKRVGFLRALSLLKKKGKNELEIDLLRKSGRPVRLSIAAALVERGRYMAVLRDLTGKTKELGSMREIAEHYRRLFADAPYAQAIVANRKLEACNDAFRDLFQLPYEQHLEGKPLSDLAGKEIGHLFRDLFGVDAKTNIPRSGIKRELSFIWKDGSRRRIEIGAVPIPDAEVRTYHCTFVDISTHYNLVEHYGESEKKYRELIETRAGAIAVIREGRFVFVNQGFCELFGYGSPGELNGSEITGIVPQRERSAFLEKCEPANALGGPPNIFSYTGLRKDATRLEVELTAETIVYDGRNSLLTYHRDVTSQRELDDQVRRKAHIYHALDGIVERLASATGVGPVIQAGLEAALPKLGYECGAVLTRSEERGAYLLGASVGLSEKLALTLAEQPLSEGLTGYAGKTHESLVLLTAEYPPHLPYKSLFEGEGIEVAGVVPLISGEFCHGVLLIAARRHLPHQVRDVEILTALGKHFGVALERAIAYDALLESETRYRSTVESLEEAAYQAAPDGKLLYLSPRIESITGYAPVEFQRNGELWRSIVHPEDRSKYSLRVASQSEPRGLQIEYRILPKKKAEYRWVRESVRYVRDANGVTVKIVGTVADITASRAVDPPQAIPAHIPPGSDSPAPPPPVSKPASAPGQLPPIEGVIESEARLREVVDAMGDAMMISNLEGTIVEVNKEFTRLTGFSRSEALGVEFPYPWLIDEETPRFFRWIAELRTKRFLLDFDMTWRHKDGRLTSISLNTTLFRNAAGEPVAMLNFARDITERRRLAVELATRSRQVEMLNRIISKANRTVDFGEIFDTIAAEVAELVPCNEVNVGLLTDDGMSIILLACVDGEGHRRDVGQLTPIEQTVGQLAMARGRGIILGDLLTHPEMGARVVSVQQGFRSQLSIPIVLNERILGTMNIASNEAVAFRNEHLMLLQPVADQIGAMIDRSRLFHEIRARNEELLMLNEVGAGLSGALDTEAVLRLVHTASARSLPLEEFTYEALTEGTSTLRRMFHGTFSEEGTLVADTTPVERTAQEGSFDWKSVNGGTPQVGAGEGGRQVVAIPLKRHQNVSGLMTITSRAGSEFARGHLRLLESIANLTEIALDRVALYEDTVAKSHEIEARNRELDEFAYVVSHDLKEPLIAIEGYSKIVLSEFRDRVGGEGEQFLNSIVLSSNRMKSLIEDLLVLSRVGRSEGELETVAVSEVLDGVLRDIDFILRTRKAAVDVPPELPRVRYNATQLGMVFRNLLSNGVKFNVDPAPRLGVEVTEEGTEYVFAVTDNGIGIAEEHFDRIFVIFQRLNRAEEYQGTGAGLTIVRKIVERHGGRIWLTSVVGKGTTFYFSVPK